MKAYAFVIAISLLTSLSLPAEKPASKTAAAKPVKALLITGGCCHNYVFQSKALTLSSAAEADIEWTVVNKGGKGTTAEIELYNDPNWAKGYDVVVHNECFAGTKNMDYIKKIVDGHKGGTPAVVI
ncbi:MAG: hypothetical protein VCA34_03245, partial [Roseibacillus sp.]